MPLPSTVHELIHIALQEDLGRGDPGSLAVDPNLIIDAKVITKEDIIVSGMEVVKAIAEKTSIPLSQVHILIPDGKPATKNQKILHIRENARRILGVERTILNFLQRTCSIATLAAKYKKKIHGSKIQVLDTRKTIPAWRYLDKKSVRDGGLWNHRHDLGEKILIKENHIIAAGSITKALSNLKESISEKEEKELQVEITNWEQAKEAIQLGFNSLLLDNFPVKQLKDIIKNIRNIKKDILLEASGKITIDTIEEYTKIDIDRVSIGALTHSVKSIDLSMLFDLGKKIS